MLKANQMFLKCFDGITNSIKIFLHDSLNIVLILAFSREFFCAKCVQFPLMFTE